MTRMASRAVAAAATFALLISSVAAQTSVAAAAGPISTLDCYSEVPSFESKGDYTFQTSGWCQVQCAGYSVMAITAGSTCLCGKALPPTSDKVSASNCDTPCQGYNSQLCGGTNYYQVYLTGDGTPEGTESGSSSSASKPQPATSVTPSVVTQSGKVVTVTAAPSTGSSSSSGGDGGGGGSSKVGIAVGVVVGLVAVASIAGGLVLFLKRRRRLAIEEEHRRNTAVNSFVNGSKSETSSTTDQRLDPAVFSHRRNSIGSIADEQDFSRRILQVRNPDRDSKSSNMA